MNKYPIDLKPVNPLLGELTDTQCPFKIIPRHSPTVFEQLNTTFRLSDYRGYRKVNYINYRKSETFATLPQYDQMYFVVHGFLSSGAAHIGMRKPLLTNSVFKRPAAVFVDWSFGADPFTLFGQLDCLLDLQCRYDLPTINTGVVGRELGVLIYQLVQAGVVLPENIHLIGN